MFLENDLEVEMCSRSSLRIALCSLGYGDETGPDELEDILRLLECVKTCLCEYSVSRLKEMNTERNNLT